MLFCFVLFFFKQKTAYEMRISDWSSDVCSSDLRTGHVEPGSIELAARHLMNASGIQDFMGLVESLQLSGISLDVGIAFLADSHTVATAWEIGRASCRERVCQYV